MFMKTRQVLFLSAVVFSCAATSALAQFSQPLRSGEIIGSAIKTSDGKKIGTVKDLAVDLQNGRVVEVIVAQGGFLGVDSKMTAAVPEDFAMAPENNTLRFTPDKKLLDGAPAIELSKWRDSMEQARIENVYQYYGLTPYFLIQEHPAKSTPRSLRLGEVERGSDLIGLDCRNQQNLSFGKVKDLIIDLPQGRVVEVVVNSGRFLNMPDEMSALPPQALHFDVDQKVLIMNMTREELYGAPHFPSRAWPQIDRDQATAVYQAYHVVPYFLPIGTSGSAQAPTPAVAEKAQQGSSQSDLDITARIEKDILASDGLSVNARAVKVTTVNGNVTLRGTVDNPEEKRRIGEIAALVVPADRVNNELQVKETARSASAN
jgi:sporulation protein YlmC with PRC-barrel domain